LALDARDSGERGVLSVHAVIEPYPQPVSFCLLFAMGVNRGQGSLISFLNQLRLSNLPWSTRRHYIGALPK